MEDLSLSERAGGEEEAEAAGEPERAPVGGRWEEGRGQEVGAWRQRIV